ncbi:hypothetical protein C6A85_15635, partial [Mycobacterium sp. ITM-2017-0098]
MPDHANLTEGERHEHPDDVELDQRGHLGLERHDERDRVDPALHRRGVRVVHPQSDWHGQALDSAAAHRDRCQCPQPD